MVGKLTERQRRFCEEYLVDGNAAQAAIRAGYSVKIAKQVGQKNLTKPCIRQYIDQKLAEMSSARIADAAEVMEYLTAVMRGEIEEETAVAVNGTVETVKVPTSIRNRLRAAELLGKRHRLFTDKVEVAAAVPVVICGAEELSD